MVTRSFSLIVFGNDLLIVPLEIGAQGVLRQQPFQSLLDGLL